MTNETPAKVLSLLGAALVSVFFLFAVSWTNAGFNGTEKPFPDPFAPAKVISLLDKAAAAYSGFVSVYLTEPAKADFALAADNVDWVIEEAAEPLLSAAGLEGLLEPVPRSPAVAGARIQAQSASQPESEGGLLDKLYTLLVE